LFSAYVKAASQRVLSLELVHRTVIAPRTIGPAVYDLVYAPFAPDDDPTAAVDAGCDPTGVEVQMAVNVPLSTPVASCTVNWGYTADTRVGMASKVVRVASALSTFSHELVEYTVPSAPKRLTFALSVPLYAVPPYTMVTRAWCWSGMSNDLSDVVTVGTGLATRLHVWMMMAKDPAVDSMVGAGLGLGLGVGSELGRAKRRDMFTP
jgi:hypothetical protein